MLMYAAVAPTTVQVDVSALSMLGGLIVPLLVGLVTKSRANRVIKAVLLTILSALSGMIALWIKADGNIDIYASFVSMVTALVTAAGSYYGVWKPTGVAPAIANVTSDLGIGSNDPTSVMGDSSYLEQTSTSASAGTPGTVDAVDAVQDDTVYQGSHLRSKDQEP